MYELNTKQIAIVTSDVDNSGINYSHLSADLIDHVCCDIESRMNQGISFDNAYAQVQEEFGIKGLRQIQQETLMLIDKNYRIMKKSMKTIGVIAMALMAFGALFKLGHWPGAAIMLAVSFFFTALVFFPALMYVTYKESNKKNEWPYYIIGGIAGVIFMVGVLFKIMHWPGASILFFSGIGLIAYIILPLIMVFKAKSASINKSVFIVGLLSLIIFLSGLLFKINHWPGASILLIIGSILLVLIFVPMFYALEVSKSEKVRTDFIFGIIAITYFTVLTFLLSINSSKKFSMDINFQNSSFVKTEGYLNIKNNTFEIQSENIKQVVQQANLLCEYMQSLKIMIIQNHYKVSKTEASQILKNNDFIHGKEGYVGYLLPENNVHSPLPKLKAEIDVFNRICNNAIDDSTSLSKNIIINTGDKISSIDGCITSWENFFFKHSITSSALNTLSLWQYNIRLVENSVLSEIASNPKN